MLGTWYRPKAWLLLHGPNVSLGPSSLWASVSPFTNSLF